MLREENSTNCKPELRNNQMHMSVLSGVLSMQKQRRASFQIHTRKRVEGSCSEERLRFRNMNRRNKIDGLDEEGISVQVCKSLIRKYVQFCWCTAYFLHSLH